MSQFGKYFSRLCRVKKKFRIPEFDSPGNNSPSSRRRRFYRNKKELTHEEVATCVDQYLKDGGKITRIEKVGKEYIEVKI